MAAQDHTEGRRAEDLAARFLSQQGLLILEKNYRLRGGEVDLIAKDGSVLVFVEVRYRASEAFGGASESITHQKQQKIIRAASYYLARLPKTPVCRFDCLLFDSLAKEPTWLKNAFEL